MKQFSKNLPPSLQEHLQAALDSGDFLDAQDYLRFLLRRESKSRHSPGDRNASLREFASALRGQENIEDFCELVVENLAKSVDWLYASLYVKQGDWFRKKASYGARGGISLFKADEGQIGQVVRSRSPLLVDNLPEYARLQFGLGKLSPAHLLLCPVLYQGDVLAILELGGLRALTENQLLWIEEAAVEIGPGLRLALEMEGKRDRQGCERADRTWSTGLFNQFSDSLVITDTSGEILEMNLAAVSLYGWSRAELLGQHINTLVPAKKQRQSLQTIARALAGGKVRGIKSQRCDKRGREFQVTLTVTLLKNDDGETTALAYQAIDSTETQAKNADYQRELELLKERLEQCQVELDAAVGKYEGAQLQLSTAVLARSEVFAKLEEKVFRPLEILSHSTLPNWKSRALARAALFEYHNLTFGLANEVSLENQEFELNGVLADVRDVHQVRSELELHFDVDPTCPNRLRGDPLRLTQVILNLLTNVAEHSASKNAILSVESMNRKGKKHQLLFKVQDSGAGLTAKQQKSLLNQKTGGLAICQTLVNQMSGTLELESQRGQGTTFCFQATFEPAKPTRAKTSTKQPNLKLLLIEDDKIARDTLLRQFQHLGHKVALAKSGPQGLSLYKQVFESEESFDVVLVNWHLPGPSGADVSQQIQEIDPEQNIVLLAGSEPEMVRKHGQELNIESLLRKPATPKDILDTFTFL